VSIERAQMGFPWCACMLAMALQMVCVVPAVINPRCNT
jgi:hypothetical protein